MRTDFLPVYPRQSRRVLPPPDRHHRQTDRGCLQSEGDPWASTRGAAAAAAVAGGGGDDAVADASVAVVAGTGPSQSPQSAGPALVMQAAAVVAALAPGSGTRIRIVIWTIFL